MSKYRDMMIFQRIRAYLHKILDAPPPLVDINILGRIFQLHTAGIRKRVDYDDAWIMACALRAETVLDIGCNQGQAALLMLLSPTIEEVILVDPNSKALVIAASNLILNDLADKARFVTAFISDSDNQDVELWTVGVGSAGSMYRSHAVSASRNNTSISTSTTTIDTLCEKYEVKPDFIKIDVEGAEVKVLNGSVRVSAEHQPRYLVEMHSNPELSMRRNAEMIIEWCQANNYSAFYLKEHILLESAEQIMHRGRCHLLLQPIDWSYPEWLEVIPQSAKLEGIFK